MTILVDMNLSPEWVSFFERESWNAVHWSVVGSMSAPDRDILERAASRGAVIFTHDLDFGTLLALKSAGGYGPQAVEGGLGARSAGHH